RFGGLIGLLAILALSTSLASAQPFTFSNNYKVQAGPIAVAAASLKNDGYSDIVVANYTKGTISVLLNNRDNSGTFGGELNYTVGTHPHAVALGDFNGDNFIDIAVANVGGGVSILINNGSGGFTQPHAVFPAGPQPFAIATGNFKDG